MYRECAVPCSVTRRAALRQGGRRSHPCFSSRQCLGATVEHIWHATHSPQGPAVKPERQFSDSISLPATAATVVGTVGPLRVLSFLPFYLPTCVTKSFCRYAHASWTGPVGEKLTSNKNKNRCLPLMARFSPYYACQKEFSTLLFVQHQGLV